MNMAVVGAARVVFGADTSDFDAGARGVEGVLGRLVDKFHEVERRIKNIGNGVTLGITVPFAAMVRTIDKGAGSFESQMKRVEAALGDASPKQLEELSNAARTLGPAVNKGATEAAGAIDSLARAGVSVTDILGGALEATLKLATAGDASAEDSAALVTDVMGQFKMTASELPKVMTNVVGALDASKLGFDDFRLAVGQGGAIAANAGVSFEDFSTAIAATSTMFTSGADAGTSFKTYIQSLTGNSKEAERAMNSLGLSFFDAKGNMKPLAEQAEALKQAFGGLSEQESSEKLKAIFGADAARTAIGLMQQGREGFEDYRKAVANGDVDSKIKIMMEGSEAAGKRIAVAWESVKIALGDAGILAAVTAIKNAFATMLEAVANAPPWVLKVGVAFTALGAALGPLLIILGHVGAMLLGAFASTFGIVGKAIALIISPVSTIIGLLGEAGLMRALSMVGTRLLALGGPIGWIIAAIITFRDEIATALTIVWQRMTETLGPPLTSLMQKVSGIFTQISSGPIGSAISWLISLLMGLKDVVGTVLVYAIELAGALITVALSRIIRIFSDLADIVSAVVEVVSDLLRGDFAGAWEAMGQVVDAVIQAIISAFDMLIPGISAPLKQLYALFRAWLVDRFNEAVNSFTSIVQAGINYVENAFPNVVAAAKSVYEGVKSWLVDKFGGITTSIGKIVDWIGNKYAGLQDRLGLGGSGHLKKMQQLTADDLLPNKGTFLGKQASLTADDLLAGMNAGGAKTGGGTAAKSGGKSSKGSADKGETAADIQRQIELEAARLRGDYARVKALEDQMDLARQIEAYERTGMKTAAATVAAKRDMAVLEAARREAAGENLKRDDAAHQIELARIIGNAAIVESLERQEEIRARIEQFQRNDMSREDAVARAERQQEEIDKARAAVRKRLMADEEQDRQLALAKARGDSDERIRLLQREVDIRERIRQLQRNDPTMSDNDALTKATREWDEMEKARQTGVFRDTFKDGVRAALDGDLKGWIKNWWRDRVAKGMEEALNSLADLISQLFSRVGSSGGGGGGILGAIGSAIGSVFGGGGTTLSSNASAASAAAGVNWNDLPGFKTGGSFKVAGNSGIDSNLVAFRATAGEIVNIERPGNDNGPAGVIVQQSITFSGAMDLATKEEAIRFADAGRQAAINAIMEANKRRG